MPHGIWWGWSGHQPNGLNRSTAGQSHVEGDVGRHVRDQAS
jgi:hypothetical protein